MDKDYEIENENFSDEDQEIDSEDMDDITEESISYISNSFVSNDETYININIKNNNTSKYLTKYELVSVLSIRSQQIARGSPILIEVPKDVNDPYEIARLELIEKKCPLMIRRYNTSNKYIDLKLNDLIINHEY